MKTVGIIVPKLLLSKIGKKKFLFYNLVMSTKKESIKQNIFSYIWVIKVFLKAQKRIFGFYSISPFYELSFFFILRRLKRAKVKH